MSPAVRLYVFDTETASLEAGVCELAIMEIDVQGNALSEIVSLIDPQVPISAAAGGVHGIRDEHVADAPTLAEFVEVYGPPFPGDDVVLIGYRVEFDIKMCASILPEKYRALDLLKVARNLWPEADNHKLQTLAYQFRLNTGTAHRALGDVFTTVNLLRHIMATTGADFDGVFELSRQPLSLDTYIGFGKHGPMGDSKIDGPRGTKLRNLPKSYIRWYLGTADGDPDLKAALLTV